MVTSKTEGKNPMKRLLQVLALASALTLCASSAVGEAYAHPTYLPIVSSDSAAPGAAEQPFGYGAFSARYPGYISYEGDGYAATGHTEGWCDADRLFTAGGFSFEVTNCESFVSLRKEADQNSERILKVNKGEQVYVNGESALSRPTFRACPSGAAFIRIRAGITRTIAQRRSASGSAMNIRAYTNLTTR